MVTLEINVKDDALQQTLRGLADRTRNAAPAFRVIGEIVRSSIIKNFREGGRPEKWLPSKRVMKEGGKTLIDKAILMNSIHSKAFADRTEIGTADIRAAIHNFGGKTGRGHKVTMPQREFMLVQDEDWPEIKSALINYIMKGAA